MDDYEDRYYKTLDKLFEVRRERDVLLKALEETQRQLELARAMVSSYKHEMEVKNDDDD